MSTIVYGASDDLIELEGDVREEFGSYDSDSTYLAFSNGVVLDIAYTSVGFWRINFPAEHSELVSIIRARGEDEPNDADGCPGYSDKAIVEGATWVVAGTNFAKAAV